MMSKDFLPAPNTATSWRVSRGRGGVIFAAALLAIDEARDLGDYEHDYARLVADVGTWKEGECIALTYVSPVRAATSRLIEDSLFHCPARIVVLRRAAWWEPKPLAEDKLTAYGPGRRGGSDRKLSASKSD